MWKYKLVGIALFLKAFIGKIDFEAQRLDALQGKKYYDLEKIAEVNAPEISGLTKYNDHLYFIVDSGGDAEIYTLNENLQIVDTLIVEKSINRDWEALSVDDKGNFYIGDIGNNLNKRKDLRIFKYNATTSRTDTLHIQYAQQDQFPPPKRERNFDGESLFWHEGKLHLFSKNRGRKCVKHYTVADSAGNYELNPEEELKMNGMITGANISPDGSLVALLTYGKIYIFKMYDGKIFENPVMLIETTRFGQSEAIAFNTNNELLVSNEAGSFFKIFIHKELENLQNKSL